MKLLPTYFLQIVLLFPMVASGQEVTNGSGNSIPTDNNFTYFTATRVTGQLALLGNKTYFNLDPYDRTRSTQYKVVEFPSKLDFFINNKASDPLPGSTYVGIEIIRLYNFEAVSAPVGLYRNDNWQDSNGQSLPSKRLEAPSLNLFVQVHSEGQQVNYLMDWHARPSEQAPSSWERRDAISNGLGLSTNRKDYVPEDEEILTAQGTYRLIRFFESVAPSPRKPVRFTVHRHGAQYLLINVFTAKNGRAAYRNQYRLEVVSR